MPAVQTKALWVWNTSSTYPITTGYANGQATKTGVGPSDLQSFVSVPLINRGTKLPVPSSDLYEYIRGAEDTVEQETGMLLTPTAVASPPALTPQSAQTSSIIPANPSIGQQQGIDYDLADAAYDFRFKRSLGNGWLVQSLRYRPLRITDGSANAVKQMAFIYPLLNQFFTVPPTWYVENEDFGQLRVVPNANLQMLPLFALQIGLQGVSDSIPGGIAYHYTAGLTPNDYNSRFRFIKQLVLAEAACTVLSTLQGAINMGLDSTSILTDGVQTTFKYRAGGAYSDLITQFGKMRDELMERAKWQVGGPILDVL